MPPEDVIAELADIAGEEDAKLFADFTKDVESGKVEQGALHDFLGDYSDKQKRTAVH